MKSPVAARLVVLLGFGILLAIGEGAARGQSWQWADPADHQIAACKVVSDGGSAGSGALIRFDDAVVVLTCRHVVDGMRGKAEFRDGTILAGKWLSPDSTKPDGRYDMAVLVPDDPQAHAHIRPIPIAEQEPRLGDRVEIMGFGGRGRLFRPYYGRLTDEGRGSIHQTVDAPVVHGDSGSVCVNEQGEVIGVQNVGQGRTDLRVASTGEPYYETCGICPLTPIRSFLRRVALRMQCGPNGCPPYIGPAPRAMPRGGGELYPPQERYPSRPESPRSGPEGYANKPTPRAAPKAAPSPAPLPELDYEKLAAAIIAQHADKLQGPPGPPGKDGRDGKDGAAGDAPAIDARQIAAEVVKQLPYDEIAAKAAGMIDLDLIAAKVNAKSGPSNAPARRHAVLITERSKSYWDSLSTLVQRAQTRYAGIRVADKPEFEVGPMPFLAVYENGVPIKQYRGLDEVSRKLTEISEGGAL